jgi:aerobic carbon-monoxide dehydrogenase medium subunit
MYATNYHRPSSVEDAVKLLKDNPDAKALSGGMTLIPTMKQRLASPSDVVDLTKIDSMKGIRVEGRRVRIAAATPHAVVATSSELASVCPAIADLASHIGDPHVRNRGTIGGSISNNDPAADYPAAMLALDATIHTNEREIAAGDFFTGMFDTALNEGELVVAVSFDAPDQAGYAKFANPASRYAMTGVFVARGSQGVRVGVTGAGSNGVFRWQAAEDALAGNFTPSAIDGLEMDAGNMLSDMHGSSEYRANLVKVMARRAVSKATGA